MISESLGSMERIHGKDLRNRATVKENEDCILTAISRNYPI